LTHNTKHITHDSVNRLGESMKPKTQNYILAKKLCKKIEESFLSSIFLAIQKI